MAEYEFTVYEPLVTAHVFHVTAATRAEALAKVLDGEHDFCELPEVMPARQMTVRDVRRGARIDSPEPGGSES